MLVLLLSTALHSPFKGYSTSGDLRCVLSTWPQFSEEPLVTQGVLDLVNVHQKVLQFLYKCLGFPPLLFQTDLVIFLVIGLDEVSSRIFFFLYVGLCFWNVSQIQRSKINRTENGSKEVLVGEGSAEKGLSLLVQQVLGRPLDKTEQMSNWKRRPLRASQIRYAGEPRASLLAADNYILRSLTYFKYVPSV